MFYVYVYLLYVFILCYHMTPWSQNKAVLQLNLKEQKYIQNFCFCYKSKMYKQFYEDLNSLESIIKVS